LKRHLAAVKSFLLRIILRGERVGEDADYLLGKKSVLFNGGLGVL